MVLIFSFGINGKHELLTLLKLKWSSHVLNANAFSLQLQLNSQMLFYWATPL